MVRVQVVKTLLAAANADSTGLSSEAISKLISDTALKSRNIILLNLGNLVYGIRLHLPPNAAYVCNLDSNEIYLVFSNLSNVSVCISHSSCRLVQKHKPVEMLFHLLGFPKYPNTQKVLSYSRFIDAQRVSMHSVYHAHNLLNFRMDDSYGLIKKCILQACTKSTACKTSSPVFKSREFGILHWHLKSLSKALIIDSFRKRIFANKMSAYRSSSNSAREM
ncbi:hypothetical protein GJ496_006302 [Pomphorhynchus laevis]|nr:hypothetical protein GJ496_006302 [Pomphorhynchus laevis]